MDKRESVLICDELLDTISSIGRLIDKTDCNSVIITGDLNCEVITNLLHTRTVLQAMEEWGFILTWSIFMVDFTFSSTKNKVTTVVTIDHFFV